MQLNWLIKSLIAMLCYTPFFIILGAAKKNYNINPEFAFLLYLFAVCIGLFVYSCINSVFKNLQLDLKTIIVVVILFLVGLTTGTMANILYSQAILEAPNPGLPPAITNSFVVIIFIGSVLLFKLFPNFFPEVHFGTTKLIGIIVVIAGLTLMGI